MTEGLHTLFQDFPNPADVERLLRQEWWMHHGCPEHQKYGDDGELQCTGCFADFKRTPLSELYTHVLVLRGKACNV